MVLQFVIQTTMGETPLTVSPIAFNMIYEADCKACFFTLTIPL